LALFCSPEGPDIEGALCSRVAGDDVSGLSLFFFLLNMFSLSLREGFAGSGSEAAGLAALATADGPALAAADGPALADS